MESQDKSLGGRTIFLRDIEANDTTPQHGEINGLDCEVDRNSHGWERYQCGAEVTRAKFRIPVAPPPANPDRDHTRSNQHQSFGSSKPRTNSDCPHYRKCPAPGCIARFATLLELCSHRFSHHICGRFHSTKTVSASTEQKPEWKLAEPALWYTDADMLDVPGDGRHYRYAYYSSREQSTYSNLPYLGEGLEDCSRGGMLPTYGFSQMTAEGLGDYISDSTSSMSDNSQDSKHGLEDRGRGWGFSMFDTPQNPEKGL